MSIKENIVRTAHDLFYKEGFHASGVELLAQNAGTTKRTLYAHFGSKDGLIDAVLDYRHKQFMDKLATALDAKPKAQTARAYLDFIVDWTNSPDFYGCMFINTCAEYADPNSSPHQKSAAHKSQIRDFLRTRLSESGTDTDNAQKLADKVFLLGEGLIVAAQTGQCDMAVEDLVDCLLM